MMVAMKCPIDETTLLMTERQGIEIDYCPECRGIWLDRGELDKLLASAKTEFEAGGAEPAEQPRHGSRMGDYRGQGYNDYHSDDRGYRDDRGYGSNPYGSRNPYGQPHHRGKKKKSPLDFLGDIFG